MRTLYELCLKNIVKQNIDYTDLPEALFEQVKIYKDEYPIRISFPDRWDSQSIIDLCRELEYPLLPGDLDQIRLNPRFWLIAPGILNILCEEFMIIFRLNLNIYKKIQVFKLFVRFVYKNSGLFALKIFEQPTFLKSFEKLFTQVIAIQCRKWFDGETVKMCEELYGCSINQIHKMYCWREIHNDITRIHICQCECGEKHSEEFTASCEECGKQFCSTCNENGCIVQHRQGQFCRNCERGFRFDDFGNVVSEWGKLV